MLMTRHWIEITSIALALLLLGLALVATAAEDTQRQRQRFLEVYEAGLKGNTAHAKTLASGLQGYVLYPYLEYALLKGRLQDADNDEVLALLERYPELAFATRLKQAWLNRLAEEENWSLLLQHFDGRGDTELQCHGLNARLQTGAMQSLATGAIRMWRVGRSRPEACDPVFEWLYDNGHINEALRFERVALSLEAGNTSLAAYLARPLSEKWRQWFERWHRMNAASKETLAQAGDWPDSDISRRIVMHGLNLVARHKDSGGQAWDLWQQVQGEFDFSAVEQGPLIRHLALDAATDYHAGALQMLDAVPEAYVNTSVRAWRIRVPLMRRDWPQVLERIDALPVQERQENSWRYWRARALEALGKEATARLLYQGLAQDISYYGFLAADRINAPYRIESDPPKPLPEVQHELTSEPAMARALELFHVGLTLSARQEWHNALANAGRDELIQAALLAYRHEWFDRTIFALADVALWDAYELRFPLAFESRIKALAKKRGLDPAWLYGLIRSESLFMTDAHSGAGAYGLMQLLPGTGRDQSKAMGLGWKGTYALMEPEYNLKLGSAYLAGMLQRYQGNPVLATAAYNAGPEEVDQWIQQNPPQYGTIWIETIPFYETRAYLKRVFAFSVLYDWQLGNGVTRLSARLPGASTDKGVAYNP